CFLFFSLLLLVVLYLVGVFLVVPLLGGLASRALTVGLLGRLAFRALTVGLLGGPSGGLAISGLMVALLVLLSEGCSARY
ncbi:hypothetical protein, partial [Photobacterium leiognathi]|uniref:hypothetical protein n=1 Tax=Photobacterium leiognathi TaxID=553611 RepID=UPI002980ED30